MVEQAGLSTCIQVTDLFPIRVWLLLETKQSKTKQNNTTQNNAKTKQNNTKQNKTKQNTIKQKRSPIFTLNLANLY